MLLGAHCCCGGGCIGFLIAELHAQDLRGTCSQEPLSVKTPDKKINKPIKTFLEI